MTTEKQLVKSITDDLSDYPAWVFKVVGHPYQMSGVPDVLVCVWGRLVGIEVKRRKPGESDQALLSRVSIHQWKQLRGIAHAGGVAAVVCSVAGARAVVADAHGNGDGLPYGEGPGEGVLIALD